MGPSPPLPISACGVRSWSMSTRRIPCWTRIRPSAPPWPRPAGRWRRPAWRSPHEGAPMTDAMSPDQLEAALRAIGRERYHDRHPFHALLHGGKLDRGQVQAWALNRFYYQSRIPLKDAALMARVDDPELRRIWR